MAMNQILYLSHFWLALALALEPSQEDLGKQCLN